MTVSATDTAIAIERARRCVVPPRIVARNPKNGIQTSSVRKGIGMESPEEEADDEDGKDNRREAKDDDRGVILHAARGAFPEGE